jgi:hypothetical protein
VGLLGATVFGTSAGADHTIRPAWFPWEQYPAQVIRSGVPRAEQFVSVPARSCSGREQGGTQLLLRYLDFHWARGESWGIYNCRLPSLHSEGRAVDFHLDINDPADRAAGHQIFGFFLKTVSGKDAVMARRWGIQEIIYDCIIWTVNGGLRRYSVCDRAGTSRTARHQDHIHIGQNPFGSGGHTSAYTGWRPNH